MICYIIITVFARSDAAATVYFISQFVQRPFESGYYSRAAFIKLSGVGTQHLHSAMDVRLDPFADIQEDEMIWHRCGNNSRVVTNREQRLIKQKYGIPKLDLFCTHFLIIIL